jgi:hypothetical protein
VRIEAIVDQTPAIFRSFFRLRAEDFRDRFNGDVRINIAIFLHCIVIFLGLLLAVPPSEVSFPLENNLRGDGLPFCRYGADSCA